MRALTGGELTSMQRVQVDAMGDRCRIYRRVSGSKNSYGQPAITYGTAVPSVCGYDPTATGEVLQGNETVTVDAVLRLPIATQIGAADRVELYQRLGRTLTPPLTFDVVGMPEPGPSALVVSVKRVLYG
jgi:hypothetical protein